MTCDQAVEHIRRNALGERIARRVGRAVLSARASWDDDEGLRETDCENIGGENSKVT